MRVTALVIILLIYVPLVDQGDRAWCGPTCVVMVLGYWGEELTVDEVGQVMDSELDGVTTGELEEYVDHYGGFRAERIRGLAKVYDALDRGHPVIVLVWGDAAKTTGHYVVVVDYSSRGLLVNDPRGYRVEYTTTEFCDLWTRYHQYGLVISPYRVWLPRGDRNIYIDI